MCRSGYISIFCEPPYKGYPSWTEEAFQKAAALQKLYMNPRWNFIYVMSRIARLPDPGYNIARISLEEIARHRAVRVRHGSRKNLINDLREEVLRLSDLRVTMTWQDYRNSGTKTFGKERPDP